MKRLGRTRRPVLEALEDRRLMAFDPSGLEQEFLQLTNRLCTDPQGELGRLVSRLDPIASLDPQIALNLAFWKVNGNELARQWQTLTASPPLAWHESLYNAAIGHNQQMIGHHDQQHQFPGEPIAGDRMKNAGYPIGEWSENIAAFCTTVLECHAAYTLDWGPGPTGIQSPPNHRKNLTSTKYREIGIGITPHTRGTPLDVGPLVNTQDLANRANFGDPLVLGAVFNDKNGSLWYDNGEGFGSVTLKFVGAAGTFQTTTMSAGGYQIKLPAGTYQAAASGGSLREPLNFSNVNVASDNIWLNFRQETNPLPADRLEPNNEFDSATLLASTDVHQERLSIHLSDNDDVFRWVSPATGNAKFDVSFKHQDGNLNLYLYDELRAQVAASESNGNQESITRSVTKGSTWYVAVKGNQRAINSDYTLDVDSPGGAVPRALDDKTATDKNALIVLDILANDTDADGDLDPTSVQITGQPQHGRISVDAQTGVVTYVPNQDFLGVDRFRYMVKDKSQLASQFANALVSVVDYSDRPWRNPDNPLDIDASGVVVPLDALVIINRLNDRGPGALPSRPTGPDSPPGFVDPSGDNFLSSIDALRVINFLNQGAPESAEGEGSGAGFFDSLVVDAGFFTPRSTSYSPSAQDVPVPEVETPPVLERGVLRVPASTSTNHVSKRSLDVLFSRWSDWELDQDELLPWTEV